MIALAGRKDALRQIRRQILLNVKIRYDASVRFRMGLTARRGPFFTHRLGYNFGELMGDLLLILMRLLAEFGIDIKGAHPASSLFLF
ncbi:MAG: hypothetical protein ACLPIG_19080 [Methylocella sp.]